ncbi:hypothetical protein JW824_10455 [bacterium]|nr:hypothetical protein [bacterium]
MKTLGEFYREKVLSQKELISVEWPYNTDKIEIKKDLFGWKLHAKRKFIECRSEEEARFLYIYFVAGMTEVSVPKDEQYLKSILPELETLKKKMDDIVNDSIDGILSRRLREKIKQEVYMEILK